jgi:hypothetical protein
VVSTAKGAQHQAVYGEDLNKYGVESDGAVFEESVRNRPDVR